MPNPKGNPHIKEHGYTTDRDESLVERLNIRITKSMAVRLNALEDKAEFCRDAIQAALDKLDHPNSL